MSMTNDEPGLSDRIAAELPYLRRYARALTGSQARGDGYAVATLEAILKDRSGILQSDSVKVGLFRCFHDIWTHARSSLSEPEHDFHAEGPRARAQAHLASLASNSREALLLATLEEFPVHHIAQIMGIDRAEVGHLIDTARRQMQDSIRGRILIIEDETIIAADLGQIITELGHEVAGVSRTRAAAVAMGKKVQPDLILADIQLADNSSGIDAVNELLGVLGDVPVIFITAFPERLLTGERPEPAFLIPKPYKEDQVRAAVSQAMFFASTALLKS